MSDKKCMMCGAPAEWLCDNELFCEDCLCRNFDIQEVIPPRRCEQCGTPIKGSYFVDQEEDNAFCSRDCALAYWDVEKLEAGEEEQEERAEEQDDDG